MIAHKHEQGSDEWLRARLGVLTASRTKALVTATGKASKGAGVATLVTELIAETLIGQPVKAFFGSGPTDRGTEEEPHARREYEESTGVEVTEVGLITTDDGRIGCSPDGLVGADGGFEIKTPLAHTHVGYLLEPERLDATYAHQVQTCLMVTGRTWWDLFSYSPSIEMPNVKVRCLPDPDYLSTLRAAAESVLARVDEGLAEIRRQIAEDDEHDVARAARLIFGEQTWPASR